MKATIGPKLAGKEYQITYRGIAIDLMDAIDHPEKPVDKKRLGSLLYLCGSMTKIEPSLNSILKSGIEKMRAFR